MQASYNRAFKSLFFNVNTHTPTMYYRCIKMRGWVELGGN